MSNKDKKDQITGDEEVRKLVLARMQTWSPTTIKSIGNKGTFSRDELIQHVVQGDEIGKTLEAVEMEWLRGLKSDFIRELYGK